MKTAGPAHALALSVLCGALMQGCASDTTRFGPNVGLDGGLPGRGMDGSTGGRSSAKPDPRVSRSADSQDDARADASAGEVSEGPNRADGSMDNADPDTADPSDDTRASTADDLGAAASDERSQSTGLTATWVWSKERILDAAQRTTLLQFIEREGVDTLFLQLSETFEADDGFSELSAFVAEAHERKVNLLWVDGDPKWAFPGRHQGAYAALQRVARINARLDAAGLRPMTGILYDVEPHLLPEWDTEEAVLSAGFVALLDLLQAEAQAAELEIWHTVPFWFADNEMPGGSLGGAALRLGTGVVVMAYRNSARGVIDVASKLFDLAGSSPHRIVVAVETHCSPPENVTFCGATRPTLDAAVDAIRAAFGNTKAFAGVAVHQYETWSELLSGSDQ